MIQELQHQFKFLLSSKKGYTWYSTKEISKILDIILRHQEFFSVDMSNLKYENNDFIIAQNDIFLYNQGLYEINTQNLLEPSTTENGIILNKATLPARLWVMFCKS